MTAFEGYRQFVLFHVSFGTAEVFSIYQIVKLYRGSRFLKNVRANKLFERGLLIYLTAFVFWLTDMIGCEYLNPHYPLSAITHVNPQFHAWWHCTISGGLYRYHNLLTYSVWLFLLCFIECRLLLQVANLRSNIIYVLFLMSN